VVHRAGQETWDRLARASSAADREHLALLLTGSWYPIGLWNRLLHAYLSTSAPDDARSEVTAIAQLASDSDMHSLFKITLRLASPAMVTARAGSLWSRYFDRGALTPTELSPTHWRLRLEAPTAEEEGPGEPICAYGVVGWAEHALRLTGARHAVVEHSKCRFAFSRYCEYRVTW
jgi:hypothetical protein